MGQFVKRVRETGMLLDKLTSREQPSTSTCRRSQEFKMSRSSSMRILHKDVMKPYKIDPPNRLNFVNLAEGRLTKDGKFYRKIISSDEAQFHLSGYVN